MAVDKEVVRAFLQDGGAVPESDGSNGPISAVPLFVGAAVFGMANSSSVIGLGVGNHTGGDPHCIVAISICIDH